jgi:tetratricopeptide (TPR) repeat protein
MSLLLEALKKAEKAKEEAQRRAREGEPAEAPPKLHLEEITVPPAAEAKAAPPPAPQPAVEPPPQPKPAAKPAPRPSAAKQADEDAAGRASAKKVFEAKFREPNPRLPFYVTLGVLGVFTVGTVVYFWYQLRPPPALVNTNPPPAATQTAQAQPGETRAPLVAPAAVAQSTIPGLPPAPAKPAAPAPSATPAIPPTPAAPVVKAAPAKPVVETPRLQPAPRLAAPPSAPEASIVSRAPAQVHPRVDAGYNAYTAGDLTAARTQYEEALRDEPGNRDALLGMGALEVRAGRYEAAEALYLRVLAADPRDPQAQAALIALRSGRSDPLVTESRVKSLLAADPAAHALNFTLGNQLASQNRWAEAQQEYFKAYTAEPDNADFAYNLAVSLDHMRQPRQALDYYRRAITLAEKRGASFNLDAARNRAAQLAK